MSLSVRFLAVGPGLFFQFLGFPLLFLFGIVDGRVVLAMLQGQSFGDEIIEGQAQVVGFLLVIGVGIGQEVFGALIEFSCRETMLRHVGENRAVSDLEQLVIVRATGWTETLGERAAFALPINRRQKTPQRMNRPTGTGLIVIAGQRQAQPFGRGIAP